MCARSVKTLLLLSAIVSCLGVFFVGSTSGATNGFEPARVLSLDTPRYPEYLIREGIEGSVVARVPIHADGTVGEPEIAVSPHEYFNRWVKYAVSHSTFMPARKNGRPVESAIEVPFHFSCPRDTLGNPVYGLSQNQIPRRVVLRVRENHLCLYGHWLSGDVSVRLVEDRVYANGIRIHPPFPGRGQRNASARMGIEYVVAQTRDQIELIQRDLELHGFSSQERVAKSLDFISRYPGVSKVEQVGKADYCVSLSIGDTLHVDIGKPTSPPDPREPLSVRQCFIAENCYFKLVWAIERGGVYRFKNMVSGSGPNRGPRYEQYMLEVFAAQAATEPITTANWSGSVVGPGWAETIRNPEWVFRIE